MKPSSHTRVGLLTLSAIAAIWAAGCSDDDDRIPGYWNAGGQENLGGTTAVGGSGATSNGGTTPQVTGGTVSTTSSTVPQAGNAPNAGAGNTPTAGAANTNGGSANTSVGGSTSPGNGGGGGTSSTGAAGSGIVCGTTPSSFAYSNTTFPAGATLPVNEFGKKSSTGDVQIVTAPAICSGGCLQISKTYSTGNKAYTDAIQFGRSMTGALTNLYGATVVAKIAVDNPSALPMQFSFYAQGTGDTSWGASAIEWLSNSGQPSVLSTYTVANGIKEFVWQIADMKDYLQRQFCASAVGTFGIMLQPSKDIPAGITDAPVTVYVQSIELRPAGYVPTGTGGSSGVAGAAGASSVSMAGNAGTNG